MRGVGDKAISNVYHRLGGKKAVGGKTIGVFYNCRPEPEQLQWGWKEEKGVEK